MSQPIAKHVVARELDPDERLLTVLSQLSVDADGAVLPGQWFALLDAKGHFDRQKPFKHPLLDVASEHHTINLYDDLGELGLKAQGPRLVPLPLDGYIQSFRANDEALLEASYLFSAAPVEQVTQHLLRLREVVMPDGSQALFRFQDGRVASALMPLTTVVQASAWLGNLACWASVDACGRLTALRVPSPSKPAGQLSLTTEQLQAVDRALLPYEILAQTNEVDSSLLHGLTACARLQRARALIARAEQQNLSRDRDISLFCVLGMQLPEDFEHQAPFEAALQRIRSECYTFSEALDQVGPDQWASWNSRLAGTH